MINPSHHQVKVRRFATGYNHRGHRWTCSLPFAGGGTEEVIVLLGATLTRILNSAHINVTSRQPSHLCIPALSTLTNSISILMESPPVANCCGQTMTRVTEEGNVPYVKCDVCDDRRPEPNQNHLPRPSLFPLPNLIPNIVVVKR